MTREILLRGRHVKYELSKKKVKNVNIRIKSDLSVSVSAPSRVPLGEIERILCSKADFILAALEKYEARAFTAEEKTKDGAPSSVAVFGIELPVVFNEGKKNKAEIGDGCILVTLRDIGVTAAAKKAIDSCLEALLREHIEEKCRRIYPLFEAYLTDFPEIKFRRMKSRWGSCNYAKGILTFNYHLVHAPVDCIEYVIYHEFTHFIHHDHSKAFYLALSRYIPDHKEKKKRLERVMIN